MTAKPANTLRLVQSLNYRLHGREVGVMNVYEASGTVLAHLSVFDPATAKDDVYVRANDELTIGHQGYHKELNMAQNTRLSHSSIGVSKVAARIAVMLAATFLALLFLLHFLEPEFDPSWRMISEYAIGRYGWMMALAFFCLGGSVLALLIALWPSLRTIGGLIGRWWLLLIGVALFGAGIFKTNALTDTTPSTANDLHRLCGAIVILTFPIAASLVAGSLARNQEWATVRRRLLWGTFLVWFGQLAFFGSIIISNVINPSAGRVGPEVLLGWPNRFMVVAYNIWLIIVALHAALRTPPHPQ